MSRCEDVYRRVWVTLGILRFYEVVGAGRGKKVVFGLLTRARVLDKVMLCV